MTYSEILRRQLIPAQIQSSEKYRLFFLLYLISSTDSLLQSIWTRIALEYSDQSITHSDYFASVIELIRHHHSLDYGGLQIVPSKNKFFKSRYFSAFSAEYERKTIFESPVLKTQLDTITG